MITLDATTKTLELDLNAAITTNQLPFVASYIDVNNSTFAMTGMGEQDGASNSTTAVTILSAPAATTSRVLKFLSVKNSDTVATLLWIQLNNNGTLREIWKGTLQVNDTLFLVDGANYKVIDANGNTKETVGTVPTSIILGTTTNDNAAAGRIGEIIESTVLLAGAITLTTATQADVTSISLTAGDWDVWGEVCTEPAAGTLQASVGGWAHTVSATFPTNPNGGAIAFLSASFTASSSVLLPVGQRRFSLSATTTIYLTAYSQFTVSTNKAYGYIGARRVR